MEEGYALLELHPKKNKTKEDSCFVINDVTSRRKNNLTQTSLEKNLTEEMSHFVRHDDK